MPDERAAAGEGAPGSNGDHPSAKALHEIARAIHAFAGQHKAEQDKNIKNNRKLRRWTRAATIGTWVYTIFTFFIIIVAIKAFLETRRAANIADDAEKRQLRAYVSTTAKSVDNFNTVRNVIIRLALKNFGQTPAYHVRICGWASIFSYPMDANYKFPECAYVPNEVTMTAFPQAEYNPDVDKLGVLTPTETASVADGTKARIGVYGTTWYTDAFGAEHVTHFCHLYNGRGITNSTSEFCDQHNDAN